ncbi:MAG: hypothetical protein V1746_00195 [bacterium]
MLFGQLRKQPADPAFNLPARRRVIWEHAQDLLIFLYTSVIFNVLFFVATFIMAVIIYVIFTRPPFMVKEDQGYVYYRDREAYKLRTDMIRSFLQVTTGGLLTFNPGGYDISGLEYTVGPRVLDAFGKAAREQAKTRTEANRRQLWTIREIRRYDDPRLTNYLGVAIKGEKTQYEEVVDENGLRIPKASSGTLVGIAYLEQVLPSPENPWGLRLIGYTEVTNTSQASLIWTQCRPIAGTPDLLGKTIQSPKDEYLNN